MLDNKKVNSTMPIKSEALPVFVTAGSEAPIDACELAHGRSLEQGG